MGPGRVRRIIRPFGPWAPVQSLRSESGGVGMSTPTFTRQPEADGWIGSRRRESWRTRRRANLQKHQKPDSVVFVGATSAESPKIEAGPDPAELARASAVLNRAGVRIMALEGGATIGVWSDLDGPEVRAALRTFGSGGLPFATWMGPASRCGTSCGGWMVNPSP